MYIMIPAWLGKRAERRGKTRLSLLARLGRDRRGVAAVEMALIAPVLIVGYFGVAEVTMAMMAQRRASHAASAVGDLVTQSQQMNNATMTDIFRIGTTMVRPFPEDKLKMRVTSVVMDANKNITVVWSRDSGGMGALEADEPIVDENLTSVLKPFESMVMTEMSYTFESPLDRALPNALTFSDKTYLKPRRSDQVVWSNG